MSSSEKRGLSICATIITIICFITGMTLFMTGCTPSLHGTCPNYIQTHGTLTRFYYKNETANIYASLVRDDNGETCNSLISDNSPKLDLNISTLYEYNIGAKYEIFVRRGHQTSCLIDFKDKAKLNTISGIAFIIISGIVCSINIKEFIGWDSCCLFYKTKRIHMAEEPQDKILSIV